VRISIVILRADCSTTIGNDGGENIRKSPRTVRQVTVRLAFDPIPSQWFEAAALVCLGVPRRNATKN
jgi:hypothetical protein